MSDIQDAAKRYRARGEHTLRLRERTKKPFTEEWPTNPPDEPDTFQPRENIGLGNGCEVAPGQFSVDFDLDWPEARAAADLLALPTPCVYGRPSAPRSHRRYVTRTPIKSKSFTFEKKEILKVMGAKTQSMAPPSVHPNKEILAWETEGDPAFFLEDALWDNARVLVTVAILARHWPKMPGTRHHPALALAGFLLKLAKCTPRQAEDIVRAAATLAHDPDVTDRVKTVDSTAKQLDRDDLDTNIADGFGDEVAKALFKLWGVKKVRTSTSLLAYFPEEVFHRQGLQNDTYFMHQGRALSVLLEGGDWLRDQHYLAKGEAIADRNVKETLATIHARARNAETCDVFTRCAFVSRTVYLDPGWATDEVIRVQASGWDVVPCPSEVKFTRPPSMLALPDPRGVPPDPLALRDLFNLSNDDYALFMGTVTSSLFGPPRVAVVFIGERGTIKTTMNKHGRRVLDPSSLNGTLPKDVRGIAAILRNTWSAHFANVSAIDHFLSDGFCRLLDGENFSLPTLYETASLTIVPAQGPLFLDGIRDFIREGDLNDRCLIFRPKPMKAYLTDDQVEARFAHGHAAQLASILDRAVVALQREPRLQITDLPRRSQYARWLAAIDPVLLSFYREHLADQRDAQTDSDDVAAAIKAKVAYRFEGTMTDLLKVLTPIYPEPTPKGWPTLAHQLSQRMTALAPGLRGIGWTVEQGRSKKGSWIRLEPPNPNTPSYVQQLPMDEG